MFKRLLLYIVIIAMFFSFIPANNMAEASGQVSVSVTANALNFRLGPGTQYWSMGLLSRGNWLTVLAEENGWFLVRRWDGETGWVSGQFTSNPAARGSVSLNGTGKIETTPANLNIRTGPGTNFMSFDRLPAGTEATVLAEENGWLLIRLNYGSTGWVSGTFTRGYSGNGGGSGGDSGSSGVTVTTAGLNMRLGPGTQYWSCATLSAGTNLNVLLAENGWYLSELADGSTGWVSARHTSNPSASGTLSPDGEMTIWTSASSLNIRTGPGTNYMSFDRLPAGTEARVLSEKNDWLLVRLNYGSTGWISSSFTSETRIQPPSRGGTGSLRGRVICIDPGHGGSDPGAVGVTGLWESRVVLDVSQRVAGILRAQGARVVMTRTGDYSVSLANRVNIAHNAGSHIFVSIHANWHPNPGISGTETYYNSSRQGAASQRLARLIQQEKVNHSGLRDIGAKHGTFYVIRTPWIPSVLSELAFLSNYRDESLLKQNWFLQGQAEAIARGITRYFNE